MWGELKDSLHRFGQRKPMPDINELMLFARVTTGCFGEVGVVFRMLEAPGRYPRARPLDWSMASAWTTPVTTRATQPSLGVHGLPRDVTLSKLGESLQAWTHWAWQLSLVSHWYHIHHKRRAWAWPAHVSDRHVNLGISDGVSCPETRTRMQHYV